MKKVLLFIIITVLFPSTIFAAREQVDVESSSGYNGTTDEITGGYVCEDNSNPDFKIVYGNVKDCTIQFGDREYGVLVDFCGKKACAQKIEEDVHYNPSTQYINVKCESGYSPVKRLGGYFLDAEYRQYYAVTVCMSKVYVANTNLNYENVCGNKAILNVVRIIGYLISVVKWIVPFIIIVLGMVDFGKAILSDDEKAPSKSLAALVRRLLAGVIIFFVPTIILAVINLFDISDGVEKGEHASFGACTRCLFDPYRDECKTSE